MIDLAKAEVKDYYIEDATDNAADNTKFDSTTTAIWTVPAGKRWFMLGGQTNRDASGTLTLYLFNPSDKIVDFFAVEGAATGKVRWPEFNQAHAALGFVSIADEGWYVKATFGAAQGSGASASCRVVEVDI